MFNIRFTNNALHDLKKLPRSIAKRIVEKIQLLEENPFNKNVKKLVGHPFFRLRVGDYRVIYEIRNHELVILIIKIGHRKKIYK